MADSQRFGKRPEDPGGRIDFVIVGRLRYATVGLDGQSSFPRHVSAARRPTKCVYTRDKAPLDCLSILVWSLDMFHTADVVHTWDLGSNRVAI
jgi:hypothetical protein